MSEQLASQIKAHLAAVGIPYTDFYMSRCGPAIVVGLDKGERLHFDANPRTAREFLQLASQVAAAFVQRGLEITLGDVQAAIQRAAYAVGFDQPAARVSIDGRQVRILFDGCEEAAGTISQALSLDNLARIAVIRAVRHMEKRA